MTDTDIQMNVFSDNAVAERINLMFLSFSKRRKKINVEFLFYRVLFVNLDLFQ